MGIATVIAALITALAAIASPIIVTFMNNRHAIKIKREEILLNGKLKAYSNLSNALGQCRHDPSSEDVDDLYGAVTFAAMFSDEETYNKLLELSSAHLTGNAAGNGGIVYNQTLDALREELSKEYCNTKK